MARVSRNPTYSLRAFARDLRISHCYLSQVMSHKRRLSIETAASLCNSLKLSDDERSQFMQTLFTEKWAQAKASPAERKRPEPGEDVVIEIDRFRAVSEWYHGAIFELISTKDFEPNFGWICQRLGITPSEARLAVRRLKRLGLIKTTKNKWTTASGLTYFPTKYSVLAVRKYHQQMIQKAADALATGERYDERDITGITFAVDPAKLAVAKKRITKFQREMMKLLAVEGTSEVYQFNVQLFPLTNPKGKKR